MKKWYITLLLLGVLLAGCGTTDGDGQTSTSGTEAVTTAETTAADTTVTTSAGTTGKTATSAQGAVQSVTLDRDTVSVAVGESEMPLVTMLPADAPDKGELWSSSDTAVATVDDIGNITGVAEGTCVITVASKVSPGITAQVQVTVTPEAVPTYIQGILIANKTYPLPPNYNPGVDPTAKAAFDEMQAAAAAEGLDIYIASSFRTYAYQIALYNRYMEQYGKEAADTFSARGGYSEHQTGLAFDLNSISDGFADTPEGKWVDKHCWEYGFIIRFPKGKEAETGYQYEPWHIRYLGKETAKAVYDSGLSLEEYLGIDSKYPD